MASLCFSHLTYGIPLLNCMKPCATDVPSHLIFDTSITVSLVNPIPLKGLRHCTQTAFKIFAFLLFEIRHKNSLKGYLLIHLSDVRWKRLIYCLFDGFMLFILCNSKTGFDGWNWQMKRQTHSKPLHSSLSKSPFIYLLHPLDKYSWQLIH